MTLTEKDIERFWAKVGKRGEDECWEWKAFRNKDGYGKFNINGKMTNAHRVAWELAYGEIHEGKCILHRCDNPPCCNPKHLREDTKAANNKDKKEKGRCDDRRGEKNYNVKLAAKQVLDIREEYILGRVSMNKLAERYKVSPVAIWHIVKRKTWKHI